MSGWRWAGVLLGVSLAAGLGCGSAAERQQAGSQTTGSSPYSGTTTSGGASTGGSGSTGATGSTSGSGASTGTSGGSSGGTSTGTPVVTMVSLPTGAALHPTDASQPGDAQPSALVLANGGLWVLLANAHAGVAAGNAFLVRIDPTNAAITETDELAGCLDGAGLAASGATLVISCANTGGTAGKVLLFDPVSRTVIATFQTGGHPGPHLAVANGRAYVPDLDPGGGVMVVNLATQAVEVDSAHASGLCNFFDAPIHRVAGLAASPLTPNLLVSCSLGLSALDATGAPQPDAEYVDRSGENGLTYVDAQGSGGVARYAWFAARNTSGGGYGYRLQTIEWPGAGGPTLNDASVFLSDVVVWEVSAAGGQLFATYTSVRSPGSGGVFRISMGITPLPNGQWPVGKVREIVAADAHTAWVTLPDAGQVARIIFP